MIITLNSNLNRNTVTVRSKKPTIAKFLSTASNAEIQLTSSSEDASNVLYIGSSATTKNAYLKNNNTITATFGNSNISLNTDLSITGNLHIAGNLGSSNNSWNNLHLTGDEIQVNNTIIKLSQFDCECTYTNDVSFLNENLTYYAGISAKDLHIEYPDEHYAKLSAGPTGAIITSYHPDGTILQNLNLGKGTTEILTEAHDTNLFFSRQRVLNVLSTLNITSSAVYIEDTSNAIINLFTNNSNKLLEFIATRDNSEELSYASNVLFNNLYTLDQLTSNALSIASNLLSSNVNAASNNIMITSYALHTAVSNYISKTYNTLHSNIDTTYNKLYLVNNSNNTYRYYQSTSNNLHNSIKTSSNIISRSIQNLDISTSNDVKSLASNIAKLETIYYANTASNITKVDVNQSNFVSKLLIDNKNHILNLTSNIYSNLSHIDTTTSNTINANYIQISSNIEVSSNYFTQTILSLTTDHVADGITNKYIVNGEYNNDLTVSNLTVKKHIIPDTDGIYDLGSSTYRWNGLYLSGDTIYIDNVALSSATTTETNIPTLVIKTTDNVLPQQIITRSVKLLDTGTGQTSIVQSVNNQLTVGTYDPSDPNKSYVKRLTADDINESVDSSNVYFRIGNVGIIAEASNMQVINIASNVAYDINRQISSLKTKDILLGTSNHLIVNGVYNSNLIVQGTVTACNLEVIGQDTYMKTGILQINNIEILSHQYTSTAFTITQRNDSQNILEFNSNIIIRNNGTFHLGDNTTNATLTVSGPAGNIRFSGNIQGISADQLTALQGVASNIQKQCDSILLFGSNYASNISNLVSEDLTLTSNDIASHLTYIDVRQSNIIYDITKWTTQLYDNTSNTINRDVSKLDNDTSNLIVGKTLDSYSSNVAAINSNLDFRITALDTNISNYIAGTSNSVRQSLLNTSNTISGLVTGILGNRWQQATNTIYYQNYVGIGTNNPNVNLDIIGDIKLTGNINNVTSNQLNNLRGLTAPLQTQIDNISINSSNNTSNTFNQLNSNIIRLADILNSNISNFDANTSNLIGSNFSSLYANINTITNSLNSRINNLNFSQWKNTTNGIYFMNSVGMGTSAINGNNKLEIFGGDLNINSCNIKKTVIEKVVISANPLVWYQFNQDPSPSSNLNDSNILPIKFNMQSTNLLQYGTSPTYSYTNTIDMILWLNFDNANNPVDNNTKTVDTYLSYNSIVQPTNFGVIINSDTSNLIRGPSTSLFNGNSCLRIPNDYANRTNFSITFWCKLKINETIQTILSYHNTDGFNYTGSFFMLRPNKNLEFALQGNVILTLIDFATPTFKWYHFAITTTNNMICVYINGFKYSIQINKIVRQSLNAKMHVGAYYAYGNDDGYNPFWFLANGTCMDDLRIYNRILSDSEVLQIIGYTLSKTSGLTTNSYLYTNAYQWNGNSNIDNAFLEYRGDSANIQSLLTQIDTANGFSIHFVFQTSLLTEQSHIIYIGNGIIPDNLIRVYIHNANLIFQVGTNSVSSTAITANTYYVVDLICSITGNPKSTNLTMNLYNTSTFITNQTMSSAVSYNDIFITGVANLVYWIGRYPDDIYNDASPITLQDLRIFPSILSSQQIQALRDGSGIIPPVINNYQIERWKESPTYYDLTYGSKYITFNQGNVGIGTTNPNTLLHIGSGGYNTGSLSSASYFTYNTALTTNSSLTLSDTCSVFDSSILVKNTIAASSDTRIKKNIKDIDDDSALQKILSIEPKTYNYIDPSRGNQTVYGFIAQQIKDVIPEAIRMQRGIIPNIFCVAECFLNVITIPHSIIPYNLEEDMKISIISMYKQDTYIITRVNNETNAITLDRNINAEKVFVYGTEVDDFHSLDKSYIYTLNVCATQKLSEKVDNLLGRIAYLEYLKKNKTN